MEEQLDIERERFGVLLDKFINNTVDDLDTDEESPKEERPSKSWNSQKLRLIEKARREHDERLKEAESKAKSSTGI